MNTTTWDAKRQQAVQKWLEQLAAALERSAGVKPLLRQAGYSRQPAGIPESLWWKCSSAAAAGEAVWIGVAKSAWACVANRIAAWTGPSSGFDGPETTYSSLLNESWGSPGELTTQPPPHAPQASIRISFPEKEAVDLLVAFQDEVSPECQASNGDHQSALGVLLDIELPVTLRFGRTKMMLEDILRLDTGSVIEFDRHLEEPIEVLVNGRVVARGEAVTVQGNYAVRISEIASRRERMDSGSPFTAA